MHFASRLLLILSLLVAPLAFANGADSKLPFTLKGQWQQGSMLIGNTVPGNQVWFNGRALSVSPDGDFVFGLDRDEKPDAEIKVQTSPEAAPQIWPYKVAARAWSIQRIDGLLPDKVEPPAAVTARIEREAVLLNAARDRDTPQTGFRQNFIWAATGRISGVFGNQRILNGIPKQPHYGVDVAVPTGTVIRAPADGVVSLAEPDLYFTGGTIIIDHGQGVSSIMVHLSALKAKVGDVVKQGDVVALSGMTGRATGPHLHWGINWFRSRLDPEKLLPPMPVSRKK
ncbi:M23 family metallopeptidase [Stenotrophobium rhamnosiphilum]|uniref:Peptidase M23 n=1 Tax=Stenotrophobium rhamnosiphilum TaxID=2029166 RepID=A0A2T5MKU0_9GAMM|nr:M23 family metallopeptidase [Stenotrophobium rhamnosiphilum]PTU33190.1 peptidase M23 [Stenotrophobium rhamnosiphilum]